MAATRPSRLALALSGLCLLAAARPRAAGQDEPRGGRPPGVVWLAAGRAALGSTVEQAREAEALCRADPLAAALEPDCSARAVRRREPPRSRRLERFGIDRHEVSVARWRRCVRAGRCPPPRLGPASAHREAERLPVTGVTLAEAAAFCAFAGGRLPTAAEWERAARGPEGRLFPWGSRWHPRLANLGAAGRRPEARDGALGPAPVDAFPGDRTPEGIVQLGGNVAEWTSTELREAPGGPPAWRPSRGTGLFVVKGGSYRSAPWTARGAAWRLLPDDGAYADVGLRCAYDPPPRPAR